MKSAPGHYTLFCLSFPLLLNYCRFKLSDALLWWESQFFQESGLESQTNLHNRPSEIIKASPYGFQPGLSRSIAEKLIVLLWLLLAKGCSCAKHCESNTCPQETLSPNCGKWHGVTVLPRAKLLVQENSANSAQVENQKDFMKQEGSSHRQILEKQSLTL